MWKECGKGGSKREHQYERLALQTAEIFKLTVSVTDQQVGIPL
jgi:hypothetical protein